MSEVLKNAADPSQVAKAKETEKQRQIREDNDLLFILSDPRGRRFIWRLLGFCGVFNSSFTGNSTTFFNEGTRSVGLWATAEVVRLKPEAYVEMMVESNNEDKK